MLSGGVDYATTLVGGTEIVATGGVVSGTVKFLGGGVLVLDRGASFGSNAALADFNSPSDVLDLADISFNANPTIAWTQLNDSSGTLTVTDGTNTANIPLLGRYTVANFTSAPDPNGGTDIFDPPGVATGDLYVRVDLSVVNVPIPDYVDNSTFIDDKQYAIQIVDGKSVLTSVSATLLTWGLVATGSEYVQIHHFGYGVLPYDDTYYSTFSITASATDQTANVDLNALNNAASHILANPTKDYFQDSIPNALFYADVQGYDSADVLTGSASQYFVVPNGEDPASIIPNYTSPDQTVQTNYSYGPFPYPGHDIIDNRTLTYTIPQYIWVDLTPHLFTFGADVVDFNNLTASQESLLANGASFYDGLGGNDVVTLPNTSNYNESVGGGKTLGWANGASGGGIVSNTLIDSGGLEVVNSGGTDLGASDSGTLRVLSRGLASGVEVHSGGILLGAGGIVSSATIESGGLEVVNSSGTDLGASDSGTLRVFSRGLASNVEVHSGGILLGAGGIVSSATIESGGLEVVNSGGTDLGASVSGTLRVFSRGLASGVEVHSGGLLQVGVLGFGAGGLVSGTTIDSGGFEIVDLGGTDLGAKIFGGEQDVFGYASGVTLSEGAQVVEFGGTTSATVISGGTEFISAGGTATNPLIAGGTLEVQAGGTISGSISFAPNFLLTTSSTLRIDGTAMPSAIISGLAPGDIIELENVPFDSHAYTLLQTSNNLVQLNNVLQVVANAQTYSLNLDPSQKFSGGFFLSAAADGGTDITVAPLLVAGSVTVASAIPGASGNPTPTTGYSTYPVATGSTPPNPYGSVVHILVTKGGGLFQGTGFIISPNTIITAAHVLTGVQTVTVFPDNPLGF